MPRLSPVTKTMAALRLILAGVCATALCGCGRPKSGALESARPTVASATKQTSETCQSCHTGQHALWAQTDHALANRPVDPVRDAPAFASLTQIADGGTRFDVAWNDGRPTLASPAAGAIPSTVHAPDLILGHLPIRQPLVPFPGGRWQPTDLAFDPARKDWFSRVERAASRLPDAMLSPSSNRAGGFPAHGLPSPRSFGLVSTGLIVSRPL